MEDGGWRMKDEGERREERENLPFYLSRHEYVYSSRTTLKK